MQVRLREGNLKNFGWLLIFANQTLAVVGGSLEKVIWVNCPI